MCTPPAPPSLPRCVGALLLAACAILRHGDVAAQTIDGVLLERGNDRPIPLGLVTLLTLEGEVIASVLSDEMGQFRIGSRAAGDFLLAASAMGYEPTVAGSVFTLGDGASMSLEFRVEPLPIEIGGVTVDARSSLISEPMLVRNGFVERAQRGFGRFITPKDVEAAQTRSTAELLRRSGRVTTLHSTKGERLLMRGQGGYCTPVVYMDGVRISMSTEELSLDVIAPVSVLEAAEIYRSATEAPPQYGAGLSGCGVILLWTKTR
ncbi:MAG TPA: TonB-dependent receptor plug domain-containing protein [Longimicrobiales bacterium]|nr:TonB-dependent receptor plug domain-containing protein [Longimicrobiales bacterium]